MIELTVKTLDSQNHKFSVADDITVKQFKDKIAKTINLPADSQRLIYCGRVLQDDKNLNEYDVNGKVIHLVQRAPPQATSASSSNGRRQQTPNSNHRRIHHHHHHYHRQPRLDGNTMYFGAMAIPADLIEEQGIRVRPPFSRTQTRLMLAQQMLNRAQDVLTRLENPDVSAEMDSANEEAEITSNSSSSGDVPSNAGGSGGGSHQSNGQANSISGSIMQAAQAATAAAIAAAVSAVQAAGLPNITIVQEPQQGLSILSPASHMVVNLSEGSENTDSGSSEESSRGNDDQSGNESLPNATSSPPVEDPVLTEDPTRRTVEAPRSAALAEVLEVLAQTNARLQPFLQQFQTLMQTDPAADSNGESTESMQRIFNSVSEVMHYLSHGYHAISDIMCDFTQPPPRSLRSRPLVIQHSAVLQAGIPIQAQINVMGNQSASNTSSRQQSPSESTTATNSAAAASAPQSNEPSNQSESAQQTSAQRPTPRAPRSQAPTGLPPVVSISPGNLEFLVELGQGGATIDSIQVVDSRRSGTSANETNTNTATAGTTQQQTFGWPRPPSAELIENLMQAMAGQMMMGRGNSTTFTINGTTAGSNVRSRNGSTTAATHSGTTSSTTGTAPTSASATAGGAQNSQARGNTATHPTTSTQTRSTSRPHVQLAPAALQGLGANSFDPFLPCNSHHLNSPRRRPRPQTAASTASAEQPAQATASATAEAAPSDAADQNNASRLDLLFAFMNHWLGSGVSGSRNASSREGEASRSSASSTENANPNRQGRPVIPPNISDDGLLDQLNVPLELSWLGLLNQMRLVNSQNEGATSILHQQFPTLAEFLHTGPDYSHSEGESFLIDVYMLVARNLTFENVVELGMGHSQALDNLQPILREFIIQRLMDGQDPTPGRISAAIDRITEEIQPPADVLEAAHIRQDVDLMASINKFCQVRLGELINLIMTRTNPGHFGRSLMSSCSTILMELAAILLHCCEDDQQGLEAMLQVALRHITRGVFPELQRWSVNSFLTQFRSYLARINVNGINVQQYIVHRESAKTEAKAEKLTSSSKESSSPVPMEVEASYEPILSVVENGVSPDAARAANSPSADVQMESEGLPEVLLQSESWPSSLPSGWVPIIARDSIRQRRQGPQPPFSDVYLAGMPSKRRKVVSNSKHRGNVSQVISERVRQAVEASGVGTSVSNGGSGAIAGPDQLGQAAAGDVALQQAYREQVLVRLRRRIHTDPDFSPERFPNTASYLLK